MFQDFQNRSDKTATPARLSALRQKLSEESLDGFLIPRSDEHQGEYVPARAERLAWLTGFTGSAGIALVLADSAAIFVDGRYTLQVRDQVMTDLFDPVGPMESPPSQWIEENLGPGKKLGFDPWLHTVAAVKTLRKACEKAGSELIACTNPVDAVWPDQPAPPMVPVAIQPDDLTGASSDEKRLALVAELEKVEADATVLTAPDSICWLFNIRGGDVPHTPFVLSFALVHADGTADWYVAVEKLNDDVRSHLGDAVRLHSPEEFAPALAALEGRAVRIDPNSCAFAVQYALEGAGAKLIEGTDPCTLPKAIKTEAELAGTRAAHIRDGAALTRFLHWLSIEGPTGTVTEISAARRLEDFRAGSGVLKDLSFDTISGAGPNGAIVHYRVTEDTNRTWNPGELYLVDSGGQYIDGTTDVTRTIANGEPTAEMRDRFTRVLKGHISLGMARFPVGTTGAELDILARNALWQAGVDYAHGTGHGVGAFLSVHEGPQGIHKRSTMVKLEPGMIVSNEPGYYKEGAYGIRIENLMVVTPAEDIAGGEKPMHGFETITLAPIDRSLIVAALLTGPERGWLNAYHARVRETISPLAPADVRDWMHKATGPI